MTSFGTLDQGSNHAYGLDRYERLAVCLVAFVLPAFNGRPYRFSSGFVCFLVAFVLLIYRTLKHRDWIALPRQSGPAAFVLAGWVLVAIASAGANLNAAVGLNLLWDLLWGYLVPFMLFMSLVGLKIDQNDFRWVLTAFALGLAFRFGYGAVAFYFEWGIPSLAELLFARYDLVRMQTYMDVTFGNTGNSASIIAIALPVLVLSMLTKALRATTKLIIGGSIVILALNLLITGSRTGLLIVPVVLVVAAWKMHSRWRYPILLALVLAVYLLTEYAGDVFTGSLISVLEVNTQADNSLAERVESIEFGLGILFDYPLGVGPGASRLYNPYDIAHQFVVAQGSEFGFLGMVFVLLLVGIVALKTLAVTWNSEGTALPAAAVFRFGALSWALVAMTANVPVNSGPTIPWIGIPLMLLALGDMASRGAAFRQQAHRIGAISSAA
jgi:hypothetical protein